MVLLKSNTEGGANIIDVEEMDYATIQLKNICTTGLLTNPFFCVISKGNFTDPSSVDFTRNPSVTNSRNDIWISSRKAFRISSEALTRISTGIQSEISLSMQVLGINYET